jgi:hypothetical protein
VWDTSIGCTEARSFAKELNGTQIALPNIVSPFPRYKELKMMLKSNGKSNRISTYLGALTLTVVMANFASADQFIGHQNGREVVVHTNPIPVFLHRLVPPNVGRHVTIREYQGPRQTPQKSTPSSNNPQRITKGK